jgi:hypothetical protein
MTFVALSEDDLLRILRREKELDAREPSSLEILRRSVRMGSDAVRSVELQIRRIRRDEAEDNEWPDRVLADFRFFVLALWQIRLCAKAAQEIAEAREEIRTALNEFDQQVPCLTFMRNVMQHVDEYIRDQGRVQDVSRRHLEVDCWSSEHWTWMKQTLEVDKSHRAAIDLYNKLRSVRDRAADVLSVRD